jgi:hypothetical protein
MTLPTYLNLVERIFVFSSWIQCLWLMLYTATADLCGYDNCSAQSRIYWTAGLSTVDLITPAGDADNTNVFNHSSTFTARRNLYIFVFWKPTYMMLCGLLMQLEITGQEEGRGKAFTRINDSPMNLSAVLPICLKITFYHKDYGSVHNVESTAWLLETWW